MYTKPIETPYNTLFNKNLGLITSSSATRKGKKEEYRYAIPPKPSKIVSKAATYSSGVSLQSLEC
jgi:hypothetical protein